MRLVSQGVFKSPCSFPQNGHRNINVVFVGLQDLLEGVTQLWSVTRTSRFTVRCQALNSYIRKINNISIGGKGLDQSLIIFG